MKPTFRVLITSKLDTSSLRGILSLIPHLVSGQRSQVADVFAKQGIASPEGLGSDSLLPSHVPG